MTPKLREKIDNKAKELFKVNWDNYYPYQKEDVIGNSWSKCDPRTRRRFNKLATHCLEQEIKARLDERLNATADISTELERYEALRHQLDELQGMNNENK